MGRNILLGFAGHAEVSPTNVRDLLGDYLGLRPPARDDELPDFPDGVHEVRAVLPVDAAYLSETVKLLWEWTHEYADFPYEAVYDTETRDNRRILAKAKEKIQTGNVSMALVDRLVEGKAEGDEVALIVAWGDEDSADEDIERLVTLAQAAEIKVMDITAGLDDPKMEELVFGDDEPEPEPEPERPRRRTAKDRSLDSEPEPESDQPRPRRGKPRTTAETAPEPAEAVHEESVEAEVSQARRKAQNATDVPEGADIVLEALWRAQRLSESLDACHAAMSNLKREPCELTVLLANAVAKYQADNQGLASGADPLEEKPTRRGGRPRSDGSPAQPRSAAKRGVKEWFDPDQGEHGEWVRAGRGRLQKGVEVRTVDPKTNEVLED